MPHNAFSDDRDLPQPALQDSFTQSGTRFAASYPWYERFSTTASFPVDELLRMPPPELDSDYSMVDTPTWVLDITELRRAVPPLASVTPATVDQLAPTIKRNAIATGADGYVGLIRNLITSSGAYVLASLTAPLIAIVLAPFLTHHLTSTNYGVLTILNTVIGLGAGLSQLGMASAFFRAYNYDYQSPKDRHAVIGTTLLVLLLVSSLLLCIINLAAPTIAQALLGQASYAPDIRLVGLIIFIQNLTVPGFAWLRAENKALYFSLLSISNLILALVANFVLVGTFQLGVTGALLATGVGYGSVALVTIPMLVWQAGLRFRWDVARNVLSFGLPLVLNFAAAWVLQLSDRYLLSIYRSLAEAGAYSIAYMIGSVIAVVLISPFTLAWPASMFTIAKRPDSSRMFALIFRWFSHVLLLAAFALALVGMFAFQLLFPPSYQYARVIIPVVALSLVGNGLYILFTTGISVQRKNWLAVIYTGLAAFGNIVLNILLIPVLGIMGAAVSTLIAYGLMASLAYLVNQRIYPIPFEIGKFLASLVVGVLLFGGATLLNSLALPAWSYWPMYLGAFILFAAWLAMLLDPRHERRVPSKTKELAFATAGRRRIPS